MDPGCRIRHLLFLLERNAAEHDAFAALLEKLPRVRAGLVENAVCKTVQGKNVDIENASAGVQPHKLPLGLHRKLFRNDHEKVLFRMRHGFFNDPLKKAAGFPAAGGAEDELKGQDLPPFTVCSMSCGREAQGSGAAQDVPQACRKSGRSWRTSCSRHSSPWGRRLRNRARCC